MWWVPKNLQQFLVWCLPRNLQLVSRVVPLVSLVVPTSDSSTFWNLASIFWGKMLAGLRAQPRKLILSDESSQKSHAWLLNFHACWNQMPTPNFSHRNLWPKCDLWSCLMSLHRQDHDQWLVREAKWEKRKPFQTSRSSLSCAAIRANFHFRRFSLKKYTELRYRLRNYLTTLCTDNRSRLFNYSYSRYWITWRNDIELK